MALRIARSFTPRSYNMVRLLAIARRTPSLARQLALRRIRSEIEHLARIPIDGTIHVIDVSY